MVITLIGLVYLLMLDMFYSYKIIPFRSFQLCSHHYQHHHSIHHHSQYYNHHNICMKSNDIDIDSNNNDSNANLKLEYALAFLIIPLLSIVIPSLLSVVLDVTASLNTRNSSIISLLLFKRLYLYTIAIVGVSIAAKRSYSLPPELGKRLSALNTEALGINLDDFDITETSNTVNNTTTINTTNNILVNLARMEKESNSDMYDSLDQLKDSTQALLLPGIISLSLLASFTFLGFSNTNDNSIISSDVINVIKSNVNSILILANTMVCITFSNIEIKNAITTFFDNKNATDNNNKIAIALAVVLSTVSVISGTGSSLWPVQNIINMCISIAVARALKFSKLSTILLALSGLVFYDFVSVIGLQQFTDGGTSIMEAVARAKFETAASSVESASSSASSVETAASSIQSISTAMSNWQPGLFEIVVDRKVSDVLGLADIVFPSILAGWAYDFDKSIGDNKDISLFSASLFGYVIGCFLLEVFQTGAGQPALVFIVPSMLLTIFLVGIKSKALQKMWNYGNVNN